MDYVTLRQPDQVLQLGDSEQRTAWMGPMQRSLRQL